MPTLTLGLGNSVLRGLGLDRSIIPDFVLRALAKEIDKALTITVIIDSQGSIDCERPDEDASFFDTPPDTLLAVRDQPVSSTAVISASMVVTPKQSDTSSDTTPAKVPSEMTDTTDVETTTLVTSTPGCCQLLNNTKSPRVTGQVDEKNKDAIIVEKNGLTIGVALRGFSLKLELLGQVAAIISASIDNRCKEFKQGSREWCKDDKASISLGITYEFEGTIEFGLTEENKVFERLTGKKDVENYIKSKLFPYTFGPKLEGLKSSKFAEHKVLKSDKNSKISKIIGESFKLVLGSKQLFTDTIVLTATCKKITVDERQPVTGSGSTALTIGKKAKDNQCKVIVNIVKVLGFFEENVSSISIKELTLTISSEEFKLTDIKISGNKLDRLFSSNKKINVVNGLVKKTTDGEIEICAEKIIAQVGERSFNSSGTCDKFKCPSSGLLNVTLALKNSQDYLIVSLEVNLI